MREGMHKKRCREYRNRRHLSRECVGVLPLSPTDKEDIVHQLCVFSSVPVLLEAGPHGMLTDPLQHCSVAHYSIQRFPDHSVWIFSLFSPFKVCKFFEPVNFKTLKVYFPLSATSTVASPFNAVLSSWKLPLGYKTSINLIHTSKFLILYYPAPFCFISWNFIDWTPRVILIRLLLL